MAVEQSIPSIDPTRRRRGRPPRVGQPAPVPVEAPRPIRRAWSDDDPPYAPLDGAELLEARLSGRAPWGVEES